MGGESPLKNFCRFAGQKWLQSVLLQDNLLDKGPLNRKCNEHQYIIHHDYDIWRIGDYRISYLIQIQMGTLCSLQIWLGINVR